MTTTSKAFLRVFFFLAILTTINYARAETREFTSSSAFAAATSDPITVGFSGILPPGEAYEAFNPLVVSDVSFSTPLSGVDVNVTSKTYYSPDDYPVDFIVDSTNPNNNNVLNISFAEPTYAVALRYGGLGFKGLGSATITLSNGYVYEQPALPAVGNTTFVGFFSTDPITSLTLSTTNDDWVVESLVLATPGSEIVTETTPACPLGGGTTPGHTPTATRLSSTSDPSAVGQAVRFVAVVVAPPGNSGTPTGTVTFCDGLTSIGAAPLQYGVATIDFTFTAKGQHPIAAQYSGDQSFAENTSSVLTDLIH